MLWVHHIVGFNPLATIIYSSRSLEISGFMEELSLELGVTDPVSGNTVSKVGYRHCHTI